MSSENDIMIRASTDEEYYCACLAKIYFYEEVYGYIWDFPEEDQNRLEEIYQKMLKGWRGEDDA